MLWYFQVHLQELQVSENSTPWKMGNERMKVVRDNEHLGLNGNGIGQR